MICYRDRTWCSTAYLHGCGNNDCPANFTEEHRKLARNWWAPFKRDGDDSGPPVMHHDYKNHDCGYIPPIGYE